MQELKIEEKREEKIDFETIIWWNPLKNVFRYAGMLRGTKDKNHEGQETRDKKDKRQETKDKKQKTRDKSQKTKDKR